MPEFECTCCKYVTDNKSNYNRHIKSTKHIKTTQSKPYCEICNKNYVNKGNFLRHNATFHPEKIDTQKKLKEQKTDNKNIIKDNTIIDHVNIVKEQITDEIPYLFNIKGRKNQFVNWFFTLKNKNFIKIFIFYHLNIK